MFPSFRLCGKSKVDIVKIVAFKFQSSKPARVGSADASAHDPPMPVSIIPTREGWVMDESGKWEAKSQFQSSQPVRVGSNSVFHILSMPYSFNHPSPRGMGPKR